MRSGTHRETEAPDSLPLEPVSERRLDRFQSRRAVTLGAGIVVALTALFALAVLGAMRGVSDDLQRGRSAMERSRRELLEGNAGRGPMATLRAGLGAHTRQLSRAQSIV
jgi:hypothetical protein